MRIKKIGCKQFAGLLDSEYDFRDGLNIVVGENESGKSTLADLLYYLFFQDTKLKGKNDTFQDQALPHRTGPYQGNRIDGTLHFETDSGTARLTKEWSEKKGRVELKMPAGGYLSEPEDVKKYLAEQLGFGRGVYDEIAFTSQRRAHTILNGLLGGKIEKDEEKNLATLSAIITKTVMETGGIALDELEKDLTEKVAAFEGRWDFTNQMPEGGRKRGIDNPWSKGNGKIVDAYYERERAVKAQEDAEEAERRYEVAYRNLKSAKEKLAELQRRQNTFSKARSLLDNRSHLAKLLEDSMKKINEMTKAYADWPVKKEQWKKAIALQEELRDARRKEKFHKVSGWKKDEADLTKAIDAERVDEIDYENACELGHTIPVLEAKLKGMHLSARIKRLGKTDIRVQSSITGAAIELHNGVADITEASEIIVPGVAEIQLFPKDIDVDALKEELAQNIAKLSEILHNYEVDTVKGLRRKLEEFDSYCSKRERLQQLIDDGLDGESWEELKNAAELPDDLRNSSVIEEEIRLLYAGSLDKYIGQVLSTVRSYEKDYGSLKTLSSLIAAEEKNATNYREKLESADTVPPEFSEIEDPEEYENELEDSLKNAKNDVESKQIDYTRKELEKGETSPEELAEKLREKEAEFERVKAEYTRWKHIQEVFLRIKEEALQNPFEDIARYFGENLFRLSDGRLSLGNVNDDLSSSISSGTSQLTANILSAGTKDTILLAFRLAVLKHLFPNGGCVAVFDDPFTDMDPKRTRLACQLLQEFAEHNQVIFTTCDEKYTKYMSGNVINMSDGAKEEA